MASTEIFSRLYKSLNREQKKAVDTVEGPVMVIAGPGTGKTQILTLRIANILRLTDTDPENILAITFTESGVYAMRRRLTDIIGSAAYKVNIFTFHGFCNHVIKTYPEEFPRIIGSSTITEADQLKIIEEIVGSTTLTHLKTWGDPFYFVRPILSTICSLKREDVSVEELSKALAQEKKDIKHAPDKLHTKGRFKGEVRNDFREREKHQAKNEELLAIYKQYEQHLHTERLYDYEDMIVETVRVLRSNKDLRLRLQEKFQYLLADEHQDANRGQNRLLELLAGYHESPNLFIVGDEKQAIFRFQGASLQNFLYFKKLYPDATLIPLRENYRSTQAILDAAHGLIGHNRVTDEMLREPLRAQRQGGVPITLRQCSRPELETALVVEDIQQKLKQGRNPGSIAVLYRDNRDAFPLIDALKKTEVPFTVESDQNALLDEDIQKLLVILRALRAPEDDTCVAHVLFIDFLKLPLIDVYRLLTFAHKAKIPLLTAANSDASLKRATISDPARFKAFVRQFTYWGQAARNKSLGDFFDFIIRDCGFLEHVLSVPGSMDKLHKLDAVLTEIKKLLESRHAARLNDFLQYLDILEHYQVLVKTRGDYSLEDSVRLMTAHRSKGQEFDTVYIVGATDGKWGGRSSRTHFRLPLLAESDGETGEEADERRLFYVALTRARREVYISWSAIDLEGSPRVPSRFTEELAENLVRRDDPLERERAILAQGPELLKPARHQGISVTDKKFLKELFLEQGLSITALNNYLECPWKYFFSNLLRLPERESSAQLYGIAIHAALKDLFDRLKEGEKVSERFLLAALRRHIQELPATQEEFARIEERGRAALSGYFKTWKHAWGSPTLSEVGIGGVFVDVPNPDNRISKKVSLLLKGKLDKIEFLGTHGEINVVDYKTGKPKSRNEIEGKTRGSRGDYKRQLVFYRLLTDSYFAGKYTFISGEIDFIEPDERGRYHRERFEVTDTEIAELKNTITQAASAILGLTFWNETCGKRDCEYCALRKVIRKEELIIKDE